jgi:hypothetical protein
VPSVKAKQRQTTSRITFQRYFHQNMMRVKK